MNLKKTVISEPLRAFFEQEYHHNANATLQTAYQHLEELYERGPDEPGTAAVATMLTETQELIKHDHEHALVSEFV